MTRMDARATEGATDRVWGWCGLVALEKSGEMKSSPDV